MHVGLRQVYVESSTSARAYMNVCVCVCVHSFPWERGTRCWGARRVAKYAHSGMLLNHVHSCMEKGKKMKLCVRFFV